MENRYQLKLVSSLCRVFPDEEPQAKPECAKLTALRGETVSFQAAVRLCGAAGKAKIAVSSKPGVSVRLREVVAAPSTYPCHPTLLDDNYERTAPGLFPDILREMACSGEFRANLWWKAFWIDVETSADTPAGKYPVAVTVEQLPEPGEAAVESVSAQTDITVFAAELPEQTLIHTEWFHSDCLADYYQVPAFSEEHWNILESFLRTAASRGINMILTPTFTQPLDTMIGGERTTVQLVDVTLTDGKYSFGFEKLHRWVRLCEKCGIRYFEIAHLFTQWGAKAAPKVMATADGEYKRIFGWDTPSTGEAYAYFLSCYLPALTEKLREWGIAERCYFHISDEPHLDQLEDYRAAQRLAAPFLKGFHMMDALSDYDFYSTGAVETPVCASNHIEPFLEHNTDPLWTYYCTGQMQQVSNRFFSMPLARTRVLGVQLYKFRIQGFLQWGFNFYNTQYSLEHINPYVVTDAGGAFPSGDAFVVYPGKGGKAEESLRLMAMYEAMTDLRALQKLETLAGRDFVMHLIEGELAEPITFKAYPKSAEYLIRLRNRVNEEIAARS